MTNYGTAVWYASIIILDGAEFMNQFYVTFVIRAPQCGVSPSVAESFHVVQMTMMCNPLQGHGREYLFKILT